MLRSQHWVATGRSCRSLWWSVAVGAPATPTEEAAGHASQLSSALRCLCGMSAARSDHRSIRGRGNAATRAQAASIFSPTQVRLARNIVENTLADTPSGYIQDPANHPKRMVTYNRVSNDALAALDRLQEDEDLLTASEVAYHGYTTPNIQRQKLVVITPTSTAEALQQAKQTLQLELTSAEQYAASGMDVEIPFHGTRAVEIARRRRQLLAPPTGDLEGDRGPTGDGDADTDGTVAEKMVVTVADCDHVRFVLSLACRRLGQLDEAEQYLRDILEHDFCNVDALESILEIYAGGPDEQLFRITLLLDALVERAHLAREAGAAGHDGGASDGNRRLEPFEVALLLLADLVVETAARFFLENGEGATTRYFVQAIHPITRALGPAYASLFIQAMFSTIEEQYHAARLSTYGGSRQQLVDAGLELSPRGLGHVHRSDGVVVGGGSEVATEQVRAAHVMMGLAISFLKMLLATNVAETVEEPVRFEYHVLSKLHGALRFVGRSHESYRICERMMALYRKRSARYRRSKAAQAARRTARVPPPSAGGMAGAAAADAELEEVDVLDDQEDSYKAALFQFTEDRALDSLAMGKRLCLEAIDEFPRDAEPWRLLALILHKEDPAGQMGDAVVAAKTALRLEPSNRSVVLLLANLFAAQKRYKLRDALLDRFKLLQYMVDGGASSEDMQAVQDQLLQMDELIPADAEEDEVELQFREINAWIARMDQAHAYSVPVDRGGRQFTGDGANHTPATSPTSEIRVRGDVFHSNALPQGKRLSWAPMADMAINTDVPERIRGGASPAHAP